MVVLLVLCWGVGVVGWCWVGLLLFVLLVLLLVWLVGVLVEGFYCGVWDCYEVLGVSCVVGKVEIVWVYCQLVWCYYFDCYWFEFGDEGFGWMLQSVEEVFLLVVIVYEIFKVRFGGVVGLRVLWGGMWCGSVGFLLGE